MKKFSILIIFLVFAFLNVNYAQLKIGYVDSDTILEKLPDAQDATKKLDRIVQEWESELSKLQQEWKTAFDDYEKRKLIMSKQKRVEVEKELMEMEKKVADYREKKFGVNGELFKQQDEIMKPIQNKIFNAIKKLAEEEDYDFIFDRSGDILFLYAKDKYDVTNIILEKLK